MKLLSVNVGLLREVTINGKPVSTGIYKSSVSGRVRVHSLNLDGDRQADLTVHGGVDKAVYAYPHEHYARWERELGRSGFAPGQFGENLTTEGLLEEEVRIGDIYEIGDARLQISEPRTPCFKIAFRMEMPQFPKLFMQSGRTGFYLRVLQEGEIGAGDAISRISSDPQQMTIRELFVVAYDRESSRADLQRAAGMPALSESFRVMLQERLG